MTRTVSKPEADSIHNLVDNFQVVSTPNGYKVTAHYEVFIDSDRQVNELDQIEDQVEKIGQHFKRRLYGETLEAADQHATELALATSEELTKNGKKPFTLPSSPL